MDQRFLKQSYFVRVREKTRGGRDRKSEEPLYTSAWVADIRARKFGALIRSIISEKYDTKLPDFVHLTQDVGRACWRPAHFLLRNTTTISESTRYVMAGSSLRVSPYCRRWYEARTSRYRKLVLRDKLKLRDDPVTVDSAFGQYRICCPPTRPKQTFRIEMQCL